MSGGNPSWGEDKIDEELRVQFGVLHSTRTIGKSMARRRPRRHGQKWRTLIGNHSHELFACDFMMQYMALFTTVYVFIVMEIGSRRTRGQKQNAGSISRERDDPKEREQASVRSGPVGVVFPAFGTHLAPRNRHARASLCEDRRLDNRARRRRSIFRGVGQRRISYRSRSGTVRRF